MGQIQSKLLIGALALIIGGAIGAYAMINVVGSKVYAAESVNEARSIADMAEHFGTWASQYKGVWIKDDGLTAHGMDLGNYIDTQRYEPNSKAAVSDDTVASYYRKNPAMVQRELGDITQFSNVRGKFRLTAQKYMNPASRPNAFELEAMQAIEKSGKNEYFDIKDGELRYARRMVVKESCMACHDTAAKAPAAIAKLYPGPQGYGYVKGGLAGIISVRLPYAYDPKIMLDQSL
jgi:hypothetical protein